MLMVKLSSKEKLILLGLISGSTNKILAKQIGITTDDVRGIMKYLLPKIGAKNRTQAAIWAWRNTETIHNGLFNGHDEKE